MRITCSRTALGAATLAGVLALGTSAQAAYLTSFLIDGNAKCTSSKIKTEGRAAATYTGCYSKAARNSLPVASLCTDKASNKLTGAFAKLDGGSCLAPGDGAARDADTAVFASANNGLVGSASGKCDAAKQKLAGKYIAGIMGCYAKAAAKSPGLVDNEIGGCTDRAKTKFLAGVTKAEFNIDCSHTAQGAALQGAADLYLNAQACLLAPAGSLGCPVCGDGLNDPGEKCDASAPSAGWAVCGPDFTCTGCNCACPTKVNFTEDASAPESIIDIGWTGLWHRNPIVSDGTTSLTLSCGPSSRPCGTCTVSGPVANGPGQLANQRCTNDTSIHCTGPVGTNTACTPGGGTCQFFGSNLPIAAGGLAGCAVNQVNGPVSGTVNVETGQIVTGASLSQRSYLGASVDSPCPRCVGDNTDNDGVLDGTCSGGTRNGLACDGNATVFNRPDFGTTSLDCPPAVFLMQSLPNFLSNATVPVTKTLSASSPNCSAFPTQKCLCDTCNNLAATPCSSNADCTAVGATVCGGARCLGGTNAGAPCGTIGMNSQCPGGLCNRPGAATQASACLDDTSTIGVLDCSDPDGDGEGECTNGPFETHCSVASGHAQRGCFVDADCGLPVVSGSCESSFRPCFLTGGFSAVIGTNTLTAVGMADAPVADASNPTLGSVACVGPTGLPSDSAFGFPGPLRATVKSTVTFQP